MHSFLPMKNASRVLAWYNPKIWACLANCCCPYTSVRDTADTASGNLHSGGDKQVLQVAAHQVMNLHSGGDQQVVLGAVHQLLLLADLRKKQYHKL